MHIDMSQWEFTRKVSDVYPGASILCKPAQSKCTRQDISQEPFCAEMYGVNPFRYHLDSTPGHLQ